MRAGDKQPKGFLWAIGLLIALVAIGGQNKDSGKTADADHATKTFETSRDCSLNDPRARQVAMETLRLTANRLSAIEGIDIKTTVENSWSDYVGHGSFYEATVDFNPYHSAPKKTITLHVGQVSGTCAVVDHTDLQ